MGSQLQNDFHSSQAILTLSGGVVASSEVLKCLTERAENSFEGPVAHSVFIFHSFSGMRGISNKSDVRAYQPRPCMRPISFIFGVSM